MRRQQKYCTQSRGGALVDLSLQYDGNQLKKVTDQCGDLTYAGAMDFKDGADKTVEYEWDANGNMTRDRNKRISSIRYNVLNLPERINYEDGHIVSYTYAADGRKLRVKYLVNNIAAVEVHSAGSAVTGAAAGLMGGPIPFNPGDTAITPGITPGLNLYTTLLTMDYCGNHVYRNGVLERTMNDYGYHADSTYYYYIKDYQGNVRAVIDQSGVLKEVNNYYPYGGLMGAASAGVQPNKYGGKELDRQNGIDWYDSQARMFDPMIGRTTTMDPMAEKNYSYSPYIWCKSTPINRIDPDGLTDYYNLNGNHVRHLEDEKDEKYMLLITSKKDDDVETAINNNSLISVPSLIIIDSMKTAYNLTEQDGNEHGFRVGQNGSISRIVTGDNTTISNDAWVEAINDIRDVGDLVAYDVHTHPKPNYIKGEQIQYNNEPSDTDIANAVGNQPCVALGYYYSTMYPNGQIGGYPEVRYEQYISFFNSQGIMHSNMIKFSAFVNAVKKINKTK